MQQQGKFLLFSMAEFSNWLTDHTVIHKIKLIQNHRTWLPDYSAKPICENQKPLIGGL